MKASADNYLEINKENWNKRTEAHVESEFYDVPSFLKGKTSLNPPEIGLLGDLKGKSVLHLQCHFGLDTLSMQRMGASATGVDLSDKAIEQARNLAQKTGLDSRFVCCDVYSLPSHLNEQFDIVFTSYGTVGWLPDINKWGEIVKRFLKPRGKFVMVDFHPALWMLDEEKMETVKYRYFNDAAIIDEEEGSYGDRNNKEAIVSVSWNHGLAEIVNALLSQKLRMEHFDEYDYSCYDCFANMRKDGEHCYRPDRAESKIPMMYSFVFCND